MNGWHTVEFPSFSLMTPDSWCDYTDVFDDTEMPFTLADSAGGIGALQVSPALYRSGRLPNVRIDDLMSLLNEFAESRDIGQILETTTHSNEIDFVRGKFKTDNHLLLAWYISDQRNIALLTYIGDWDTCQDEAGICEEIVKTFRFGSSI